MPKQRPLIEWTPEEIKENSAYLAARIMELGKIKNNKKQAVADFNRTIEEMEDEISHLAFQLDEQIGEEKDLDRPGGLKGADTVTLSSPGEESVTVTGEQFNKAIKNIRGGKS